MLSGYCVRQLEAPSHSGSTILGEEYCSELNTDRQKYVHISPLYLAFPYTSVQKKLHVSEKRSFSFKKEVS